MGDQTEEFQEAWDTIGDLIQKVSQLEREKALILSRMEHAVDQYAALLMQIDDMKEYMCSCAAHPGIDDGLSHWDAFLQLNTRYSI